MSLLVEHLGFFLVRFKVESSSFSSRLRTADVPILLLKLANSLLESLDSGLSESRRVRICNALLAGTVVDFL